LTVPIELIIATATALFGLGSIIVHLLLRISNTVTDIRTGHKVSETETRIKLEGFERHLRRNEAETAQLQRHLNLSSHRSATP
jgi:hypothetical protein